MSAKRKPPDDAREWLRRARSNLIQAASSMKGVYLDDLCFNAQQAAEKAIKAVLIHRGVRFPYVHDIAELLTVVLRAGGRISRKLMTAAAKLTRYAVAGRYPGPGEPVGRREWSRALAVAGRVVVWAERAIEPRRRR